jgi:hypothetical protein
MPRNEHGFVMTRTIRAFFLASICLAASFGCSADGGSNEPPVIVGVPSDQRVEVGETLRLTLSAADPEGSSVSFDYTWRPENANTTLDQATFFAAGSEASFEWAPIASDVTQGEPIRVIFIARDDAGAVTEKTMALTVAAGNGVPRFTSNASELYDPRVGGALEFDVTVRDDDSTEVQLEMDQDTAPFGSAFDQVSGLEGRFVWEPTPEQLMRRVHSVTFRALDDQNNESELTVSIVIRTKTTIDVRLDQTDQACPGEAVVAHEPLQAQDTLDNYTVAAQLVGDSDRFDEVFVYWTTADAYNGDFDPTDEDKRLNAVKLESAGGVFTGEIPNQVDLVQPGRTVTIAYNICAIDNEASGSDAVVCAPSSGDLELFYTFAVYRPDEASDCIEDSIDVTAGNDTIGSATGISESWSYYRTCDGNPDFHSLQVRPGEAWLLAAVYPDGQPVSFEAFDEAMNPVELKTSTCTGLVSAELTVPDDGSTTNYFVRATGDNVNYQVRAFRTQGGAGGCVDDAIEPNDTALDAAPVQAGDNFAAQICTADDVDLYAISLNPGDQITVSMNHPAAAANLDLELYAPSQFDEVGQIGAGVAFTFTTGVDDEVLEHEAEEGGTYYVLVFNNNDNAVEYTLDFAVDAAPPCPDNDTYTSAGANHTEADAALLPTPADDELVNYDNLEVCPGKPDWYRRTEFASLLVLGEVSATGGDGTIADVSVEVYDSSGTLLTTGTNSGTSVDFDFTPATTGVHFYKISTTARVTYDILLAR